MRSIREKDGARDDEDAAADADQVLNQRDGQVMPVEGMDPAFANFISDERAEDRTDDADGRAGFPVRAPGLTADHAANKSEDDAADHSGRLEAAGSGRHFIHDDFSEGEDRQDDDRGPGMEKVKRAAGNVHVAEMECPGENGDGSEGAQPG